MNIIAKNIKGIMLVTGVITCSMIFAAIAPEAALMNTFGASISGPLAEIVVRSWGMLITLVGAMLIYGALRPVYRSLVLVVACISKAVFVGLILIIGGQFMDKAVLTVIFDTLCVLLYTGYLLGAKPAD